MGAATKVQYYIDYFLSKSDGRRMSFPDVLQVGVVGEFSPVNSEYRGNLKSTSPEEARHALILAIHRDIESGASNDELLSWRKLVLSTVTTFTVYETEDDLFWAATNHREAIGAQFEVVYYSTAGPRGNTLVTVPIKTYMVLQLA